MSPRLLSLSFLVLASSALADGPKDNIPTDVRPIPPPGIEIPQTEKDTLTKGLEDLAKKIAEAKNAQAKNPLLADLLPDVEIYHKSVDWALRYNEFFKPEEFKGAQEMLTEGVKRAEALAKNDPYWTRQKGLVVRAYRSRIDGSVQPYGMVIPQSYNGGLSRLDFWIHGRGEKLSELSFLLERTKQTGQIQPAHSLVLHPYGRYCCANKMAGEVDLFEALTHARKTYNIDSNRIMLRGFSMGGAAVWQFGAHYTDLWAAINPGAGFAETPEFLRVFQTEEVKTVPWYQQKLWRMYNATDYAVNFYHSPTIAYSGEKDKQKQAADVMAREMLKEGLELTHIIGPDTEHKIHPDSLVEMEKRLADIASAGRQLAPTKVHFTTWTLRYNEMHWISIDQLQEHWEKTRVDAEIDGDDEIEIKTSNVTALTLDFAAGQCPLTPFKEVSVKIDGNHIKAGKPASDRSLRISLIKEGKDWKLGTPATDKVSKVHGLQGPIDDAFWDAFVYVTPTGTALNEPVGKWVTSELNRAAKEWRKQFRGDAPQVKDTELKDEQIASKNLVLWGDPSSNAVLKKIIDKLPIKWTAEGLEANGVKYGPQDHVPVLIYPNPLNPKRYVVINSSFTYREYDYLNNARQVPKLPDWAVVNLSEAPSTVRPGKITDAGFFDEAWQWKPAPKQ